MFFLATFSRTNGNFSDFLSNETVFHYFVPTFSRANGNLTENACTKNENGNPFIREDTVHDYQSELSPRRGIYEEQPSGSIDFRL